MQKKIFYMSMSMLFFMILCCASSPKNGADVIEGWPKIPEKVVIDNTEVFLECYLWRDFMPISPPDGKPLRVVVTILPSGFDSIPSALDAQKIWVIQGEQVWDQSLQSVGEPLPDGPRIKLEKMAAGGPKWGPGNEVVVVVQLIDKEGKTYLLKAERQLIHRTD